MKNTRYGVGGRISGKPKMKGIAIAAMIFIVAVLAAYLAIQPGVTAVTSMATVYLKANQTSYFGILGSVVAIRLQAYSGGSATLYASQSPVLFGPISVISLAPGASANVSSGGSGVADMNVRLVSGSASGVTLAITPLQSSLGVRASGGISLLNPISFGSNGSSAQSGNASVTTTVPAKGSATTSTTVSTVTTTVQSQPALLRAEALNAANSSTIGKLMLGLKALYVLDANCDANTYAITYDAYYNSMPPASVSFSNVSEYTPTGLVANATELGASSFKVTYSTVSHSPETTGPAVTLTVNTTTGAVTNPKFMGNVFMGFTTTQLTQLYDFQSSIPDGNPCAAFIAPT